MGLFSSRPVRSGPEDVTKNLLWSLDEACFWEEEAPHAQVILSEAAQALNKTSAKTSNRRPADVVSLETQVNRVLSKIDTILSNEKALSKHDPPAPNEYPAAHPVHSALASRTFASAATEQLGTSVKTIQGATATVEQSTLRIGSNHPQSLPPSVTTSGILNPGSIAVSSVPVIPPGTKATLIEGALDVHNTHTASPPMVDANELASVNPAVFFPEQLVQQARIELSAKFLFIYSLLTKLIISAEHCYKLTQRVERLKAASKTKNTKAMSEHEMPAVHLHHASVESALNASLQNFDRARDAVVWLRRDYELSYAFYQNTELTVWTKDMRNKHTYETDRLHAADGSAAKPTTVRGEEALVDTHQATGNEQEIKTLEDLLGRLQDKQNALELCLDHNERRAMSIALDYLDTNSDGKIRPEDCPRLSDVLFKLLQDHKGEITSQSMNEGMMKLSKRIGESFAKMKELENTPKGHVSTEELREVLNKYHQDRHSLRELNAYFHQYFVQHVFNALNEDVKQQSIDLGFLQQQLAGVELQAKLVTDPMSDHQGADILKGMQTGTGMSNTNTTSNELRVESALAPARQNTLGFTKTSNGQSGAQGYKEATQYQAELSNTKSAQRI